MMDVAIRSQPHFPASRAARNDATSPLVAHLSHTEEAVVRQLPGNDRCADCCAVYPQWAGVSFGVLLCLTCAGRHRALGVGTSFVKSLAMDHWSETERAALHVGGNAKWTAICAGTGISDLSVSTERYQSEVAHVYKRRVLSAAHAYARTADEDPHHHQQKTNESVITATGFLAQLASFSSTSLRVDGTNKVDVSSEDASSTATTATTGSPTASDMSSSTSSLPPSLALSPPPSPPLPTPLADAVSGDTSALHVKCTTCHATVAMTQLDTHSKHCVMQPATSAKTQQATSWRTYCRSLGEADRSVSLGLSLVKTKSGFAEVAHVAPGGAAERGHVLVGSFVVGLDGHRTSRYDELVALVASLPRPIAFHFAYRTTTNSTSTTAAAAGPAPTMPMRPISSVPEPVQVTSTVEFHAKTLGCSLQRQGHHCVVVHVEPDGEAHARGVLIGSRVVEVNGHEYPHPKETLQAVLHSARPVKITFRRVEGLMRGWTTAMGG